MLLCIMIATLVCQFPALASGSNLRVTTSICAPSGQDLASLQSPDGGFDAWNITFTLKVSDVTMGQLNCQAFDGSKPEACLSAQGGVTWDNSDSVTVIYTPLNVSADATSIEVRMCYSKPDTVDRPWRKVGGTVAANIKAQCKYLVTKVDSVAAGEVTWVLPSTTPDAALFPRIFTLCGEEYCGIGNTPADNPYLFLGVKMNTTPGSLVAAVIICASIGPVLLIGYLAYGCMMGNKSD